MSLASTLEIIEELKAGRMVVLVDEEDRENEGDLVMAAEHVTPEAINFMAKYGRGLICLTLTDERCRQLGLKQMVNDNQTPHGTAFTISIEAAEGVTTGISAADRAVTINRVGPMLTMFFCEGPVRSFAEAKGADTSAFASYWRHMLERGVYLAPSQFEAAMISLALTDEDLGKAAAAAQAWFSGAGA